MRKLIACLMIASLCLPTLTSAADFMSWSDRPHELMLYVKLDVGSSRQTTSIPSFGFRLNQEVSSQTAPLGGDFALGADRVASLSEHHFTPMLDLQFNVHRKPSMLVGGTNFASSGEVSVWRNPWVWVGIVGGVLLISCATDNFPCDSGGGGMGGGY